MTGKKSKGKSRSFALLGMTSNSKGKGRSRFPAGMTGQKSKGNSKSRSFALLGMTSNSKGKGMDKGKGRRRSPLDFAKGGFWGWWRTGDWIFPGPRGRGTGGTRRGHRAGGGGGYFTVSTKGLTEPQSAPM